MSGVVLRLPQWCAVLIALSAAGWLAADEPSVVTSGASSITFENDIVPILEARCIKCHGQDKTENGLDLRRRFTLLKGGDNGAAIVPGKPDESLLVRRIEKGEMPPKDEGRLDEKQRSLIRAWVAGGAVLANPREQPIDEGEAAHRVSESDRRFWAFQPPVRTTPPAVASVERVRTPIDAFLLAKLEPAGLSFNPDAPREVLLRRLSLDLHGLPPTPEDLQQFLTDDRPDAYEQLVDRLLASPRYGERWARHWLDVAGYADSDGYLAADRLRPEAWRYRDYVIAAHNDDLPFDRFLTEQLAGDELSDWRRADELNAEMIRQLTATGFLRTALDPTYPGYTEPNEIHQVISDTVQIVGTTFLGLTIQCARCHSHKFDPISQRDYYSLQAFFLPALDPARWQPSEVRGIVLATDAQAARMREHNQKADERINYLNAALGDLATRFRKRRIADELVATRGAVDPALLEKLTAALAQPAEKRNDEQKSLVARHVPMLTVAESDLAARYGDFKEEADRLKAAVTAEQALRKQPVLVRGLVDLDDKAPVARLLTRGDHTKPGPTVEPAVPEVLHNGRDPLVVSGGYNTTGRRLALALFDTPMMEVNCPQRAISTVPMQALAMLHGPFTERAAAALADRIQSAVTGDDSARIDFVYRLMFARPARANETQSLLQSLAAMEQDQLAVRGAAATEADRAAARRAAWTQIALVLLNTNEFVYVH